jgi:hypothetical protein
MKPKRRPRKPGRWRSIPPHKPPSAPGTVISHCTINGGGTMDENTKAAVMGLADAISANAQAIRAKAEALKMALDRMSGMKYGISIGSLEE